MLLNELNEDHQEKSTDDDLKKYVEIIKRDCKPYLKQVGNSLLWHGAKLVQDSFVERTVRKNRKPLDTHLKAHEYADDFLRNILDTHIDQMLYLQ